VTAMASILTVCGNASGAEFVPRPEHPRPDFERTQWLNLNGVWEFAFDPNDVGIKENWFAPNAQPFPLHIVVPFPWESKLSGIGQTDYKGTAWYRRNFTIPKEWQGKRIWLCFGAVDWHATVWLNGEKSVSTKVATASFALMSPTKCVLMCLTCSWCELLTLPTMKHLSASKSSGGIRARAASGKPFGLKRPGKFA